MKKLTTLTIGLLISVTVAFAHSDAFKPTFVDTLVEPYLAIQKALAGDDLNAAKAGASSFLVAMKKAPSDADAQEASADLYTPAKAIASASDIKEARSAFLTLSQEVTSLVEHVGTTKATPLYVAHCPMAFDNKGGSWMQSNKTVSNPYYGSMMLRCGSIQKQIAGSKDDKDKGHSGHAH